MSSKGKSGLIYTLYGNVSYPPLFPLGAALKIVTTMEDLYMFLFNRLLCQITFYILTLTVLNCEQ